jgi:hypothetical protein
VPLRADIDDAERFVDVASGTLDDVHEIVKRLRQLAS